MKLKEIELNDKCLHGNDTVVACQTCGRRQYLQFINGMKNGFSMCHGLTMPIIYCKADVDEVVTQAIQEILNDAEITFTVLKVKTG